MSAKPTHKEIIERHRLENIASDSTKSEAERELARTQMEQLRNAAIARAELRKLKSAKPKPAEGSDDLPLPVKPTREADESDADFKKRFDDYWDAMGRELDSRLIHWQSERWFTLVDDLKPCIEMFLSNSLFAALPNAWELTPQARYQKALELWQIVLNDAAAQRILDSPTSSHSARQSAERVVRKSVARFKELSPEVESDDSTQPDAVVVAPAVDAPSKRVWIAPELEPGSEAYRNAASKLLHLNGADSFESLQRWYGVQEQWEREHPASFKAECERREKEDEERRRRNLEEHSGLPAAASTVVGKPYIASPLQKEAWKAQSEKFARQRGETVSPSSEPAVPSDEPPQQDIIFVLEDDGFMFYADNSEAKPPFALGASFVRCVSNPPGYVKGDFKIGPYKYDRMTFSWWRV